MKANQMGLRAATRKPSKPAPKRSKGTAIRRQARMRDIINSMQSAVDADRRKPAARSATPLLDAARAIEARMRVALRG